MLRFVWCLLFVFGASSSMASAQAPSSSFEVVTPSRGSVDIRVTSNLMSGTLYRVDQAHSGLSDTVFDFVRLCAAPCQLRMPSGNYQFAIAANGAVTPLIVATHDAVTSAVVFDIHGESHSGRRTAAWVVSALSVAFGVAGMIMPFVFDPLERYRWPVFAGAAALTALGPLISFQFIWKGDEFGLQVTPDTSAATAMAAQWQ